MRGRDRHGRQCFLRGMKAAECLEVWVVQRLDAERHAVDAGRAVALKARRLHAGGIGFQRDFGIGLDGPMAPDTVEDAADRGGFHERGRAATEEDRRHGAARRQSGPMCELLAEGGEEACLFHGRLPYVTVEVAIGAFRQTERPMDVDAEARVFGTGDAHETSMPRLGGTGHVTSQGQTPDATETRLSGRRRLNTARRPVRCAGRPGAERSSNRSIIGLSSASGRRL